MIQRTHHACFSGDPTCSGCDPCPRCALHHAQCVLPLAIRAAGLDGALLADLHVLIDTVRAASDRMRLHADRFDQMGLRTEAQQLRADAGALALDRLPLTPDLLTRAAHLTEDDQLQAFKDGYAAGWRRLHESMANVEEVRAEVVRTLVARSPAPEAAPSADPRPAAPASKVAPAAIDPAIAAPPPLTVDEVAASIVPAIDEILHVNGKADGTVVS